MVKIGRAGGKTSNRETPDQIGRVGISGHVLSCLKVFSCLKVTKVRMMEWNSFLYFIVTTEGAENQKKSKLFGRRSKLSFSTGLVGTDSWTRERWI